jgi:hypothetical protein
MASCAMAHFKLDMKLKETGYSSVSSAVPKQPFFFTADGTDCEPSVRRRLTLVLFLFICVIPFIRVICGS